MIHTPVLDVGDMGAIPVLDEAHCIPSLQAVYHGVFTIAGSSKPRILKYYATFALPAPPPKESLGGHNHGLCTALSTK